MSIDLEWRKLDSSLAASLIDVLNKQLANTTRPSFIGPVEVASFEFGSANPDIELVDLCDIYRDFLEDDEEPEEEPDPAKASPFEDDEDGFEWVSRRTAREGALAEDGPMYHMHPPHMRYGRPMTATDMLASTPGFWSPGLVNVMDLRPAYATPSLYGSALSALPPMSRSLSLPMSNAANSSLPVSRKPSSEHPAREATVLPVSPKPTHPNLQMHLHISWSSNMRLTLTTSLLINYPSPMFMSLPIKLSVTGLLFNGEVVVAYEGERKRVHMCIVDPLDPYSPLASDRPKRDTPPEPSTPNDADEDGIGSAAPTRAGKPLPIGQRLLPSIYIESEIGQADKHVLKNVTRVERFIQDVIRKTVEEELVFPNFHTLILDDADSST